MAYKLEDINYRTASDPKGLIEEADALYEKRVRKAAEMILENKDRSPIILLSGPSGSGKTTTARKISEEMEKQGVFTHYVSLDDYYNTVDEDTVPRTPDGKIDLESPLCLDIELLNRHFTELAKGERIDVPKYEFSRRMRAQEPSKSIQLKKDEMVLFEGIHALNSMIAGAHPEAFRLFISPRSGVTFHGKVVFRNTWFRLARRAVRDFKFRGTAPEETISMWATIRRGERVYISPFRKTANYQFDTSFSYELPVLNSTATKLFMAIHKGTERFDELKHVFPALMLFGEIDESLVHPDALIREFIGGGIYGD